jgi:YesN/AraC family two-component response regulator
MNGVEVLETLKKKSPDLQVIMLTGYPTVETARMCQALGAGEYCVKPIDKDDLEDKVARLLADGRKL